MEALPPQVLMDDLVVVRDSAAISPRYVVMYTREK